jgi:hypothetical protein
MQKPINSIKKKKQVVRKFTADSEQGSVAMLAGSTAEGLPLKSITRKGNKVIAIYEA